MIAGHFGDLSACSLYPPATILELDNKGHDRRHRHGPHRTQSAERPISDAALGRLVYEPDAHSHFRITGEYVDSPPLHQCAHRPDPLPATGTTIDLLQARDTRRGRIASDWTWL